MFPRNICCSTFQLRDVQQQEVAECLNVGHDVGTTAPAPEAGHCAEWQRRRMGYYKETHSSGAGRLQVGEQGGHWTAEDVSQSAARTSGSSHDGGASCVVDVSFQWGAEARSQFRSVRMCKTLSSPSLKVGWSCASKVKKRGSDTGDTNTARLAPHRSYARGVQCFRRDAVPCKLDLAHFTVNSLQLSVGRSKIDQTIKKLKKGNYISGYCAVRLDPDGQGIIASFDKPLCVEHLCALAMVILHEFNVKKLGKRNTISTYTRQKAKSKYRDRVRLERASENQSSDTHKTPYDRVKRYRERKINIKASEHLIRAVQMEWDLRTGIWRQHIDYKHTTACYGPVQASLAPDRWRTNRLRHERSTWQSVGDNLRGLGGANTVISDQLISGLSPARRDSSVTWRYIDRVEIDTRSKPGSPASCPSTPPLIGDDFFFFTEGTPVSSHRSISDASFLGVPSGTRSIAIGVRRRGVLEREEGTATDEALKLVCGLWKTLTEEEEEEEEEHKQKCWPFGTAYLRCDGSVFDELHASRPLGGPVGLQVWAPRGRCHPRNLLLTSPPSCLLDHVTPASKSRTTRVPFQDFRYRRNSGRQHWVFTWTGIAVPQPWDGVLRKNSIVYEPNDAGAMDAVHRDCDLGFSPVFATLMGPRMLPFPSGCSKPMMVIEVNMEQRQTEGAGENGRFPRKHADQRHRSARFPLARIRRPGRGLNPVRLGGRRINGRRMRHPLVSFSAPTDLRIVKIPFFKPPRSECLRYCCLYLLRQTGCCSACADWPGRKRRTSGVAARPSALTSIYFRTHSEIKTDSSPDDAWRHLLTDVTSPSLVPNKPNEHIKAAWFRVTLCSVEGLASCLARREGGGALNSARVDIEPGSTTLKAKSVSSEAPSSVLSRRRQAPTQPSDQGITSYDRRSRQRKIQRGLRRGLQHHPGLEELLAILRYVSYGEHNPDRQLGARLFIEAPLSSIHHHQLRLHERIPSVQQFSIVKAVRDKVSTFEINLRKKSLFLPTYILTGAPSDMHLIYKRAKILWPNYISRPSCRPAVKTCFRVEFAGLTNHRRAFVDVIIFQISGSLFHTFKDTVQRKLSSETDRQPSVQWTRSVVYANADSIAYVLGTKSLQTNICVRFT
ncbi:hypothetical protein PR048_032413 [Dryococelus australis]|uniref:Uncharacterized protein n=1 Tax=Dryococelus australis TaxID=614101 RepID=A0ABQ9G252_9NEOP|nr:hypothetical protein PR048_032413 [Dryococelus australis]